MGRTFEILLTKDEATSEDWERFFTVVSTRVRGLHPFEVALELSGSVVHYYVRSRYDLSRISEGIEGFVLRDAKGVDRLFNRKNGSRWRFKRIRMRGNALEIKEWMHVRKGIEIGHIHFRILRFGQMRNTKVTFFADFRGISRRLVRNVKGFPSPLLGVDFGTSTSYLKRTAPTYLSIEKTTHLLNNDVENALFEVQTYPYLPQNSFVGLNDFDFAKHSFVVGATGSGKSKLIELFADRLRKEQFRDNYRVVVIDPHASLEADLNWDDSANVINFAKDTAQMFPDASADLSAATELTSSLLTSLINADTSPRLERVLRFSIFVLNTAQVMSLPNLRRFLTELDTRTAIIDHVQGYVPIVIEQFFGSEFNEIRSAYYNEAIQPIVALVDELQLQPALVSETEVSLAQTINDNFLTVFSLNKISMGEKVVRTVAGLLIQQIFLLAQARMFPRRVLLIIDEVSVIQNPTLAAILAEARKFGLTVFLTQQYFDQIDKTLQAAILSNVTNYYAFKVSEQDARSLAGSITMEFPREQLELEQSKGRDEFEMRVKLLSELSPRECVVRVSANGETLPAVIARTVDIERSPVFQNSIDLDEVERKKLPPKFEHGARETSSPSQSSAPKPEVSLPKPTPATKGSVSLKDILATQSSVRPELMGDENE